MYACSTPEFVCQYWCINMCTYVNTRTYVSRDVRQKRRMNMVMNYVYGCITNEYACSCMPHVCKNACLRMHVDGSCDMRIIYGWIHVGIPHADHIKVGEGDREEGFPGRRALRITLQPFYRCTTQSSLRARWGGRGGGIRM
jgi:hypothetical protein